MRNLKNLGFRVPLAIVNKAHQANQLYPFAISLIESVRTYERTLEKVKANKPGVVFMYFVCVMILASAVFLCPLWVEIIDRGPGNRSKKMEVLTSDRLYKCREKPLQMLPLTIMLLCELEWYFFLLLLLSTYIYYCDLRFSQLARAVDKCCWLVCCV